jgi:predicted nucleic acid-binding protein
MPEMVVRWCLVNGQIVGSRILITEIVDALEEQVKAPHKFKLFLRQHLDRACLIVDVGKPPKIVRDPTDDHIIAAAVNGQVEVIVSNDLDLLDLGQYRRMPILKPPEFLEIYST